MTTCDASHHLPTISLLLISSVFVLLALLPARREPRYRQAYPYHEISMEGFVAGRCCGKVEQ